MSGFVASLRKTALASALLAATPANAVTIISSEENLFAPSGSDSGQNRSAQPFFSEALALPAPEPATWAMMLVGFGSIGLVVRSRSRRMAKFVNA